MADKAITRRLKIFVNGQEVDATISNLTKSLSKFRAQSNRAVEGTDEWRKYNAEVARLETELKQARDAQKAFRTDTKLTEAGISKSSAALTDFTGHFSTMINGYKSGDILQVKEGFTGVRNGIAGATKAALAFIATPIGAAITVLVGVGAAAKAWFDYNSAVVESLRLTQQITGLTDGAADNARIRAEALSETFDVDFKETLLAANTLAQQFGISFNEAFDTIEGQLVRGQANNDEFFDNLNEYPTFFKQAGFSAEEFGKIIATGYDLGIYKDKLPDALKEFDLAIKEQTQTTKDALVNAFGAPFANDILQRVKTGQTTSKQALEEIAIQAEESNINIQQNAQLTADLFKGAGEDAGGALNIFEAYNTAIVKNQRQLTESEQITQEQINATKELKAVSSALFATGDAGFGLLVDKAKLFGTKILVDLLKSGVDVYNWVVDLNNESGTFSAILVSLGVAATASFKVIGILVEGAKKQFAPLGDIIEGVFTLDFSLIKKGLADNVKLTTETFSKIAVEAKKDAAAIQEAFNGGFKLERKSIDDFIAEDTPVTTQGNAVGGNGASIENVGGGSELTPEDKKILESRKKLKEYLDQFEADQAIQEEIKKLDEDQRAEEEEVLNLEAKFEKLREDAGLKNEITEELSEEEKSLQTQLEEAKETELQEIRDKYATERQKKQDEADKKAAKKDAENKKAQLNAEKQLQDAKRGLLDAGISAVKGFFDESSAIYKALFIGEKAVAAGRVIIDGIAERAKIAAAWGWNPAVATPLLAASKIRTATSLITIAGTAIQGFEDGGDTFGGSYSGGVDGRGGRISVLHPDEYVVPKKVKQMPGVPRVLEYLEALRTGNAGSFEDGGTAYPTEEITTSTDTTILSEVKELLSTLSNQIKSGLKINYTLESEVERRELAEKLDATINESKGIQ